jgi:hypothetical protein
MAEPAADTYTQTRRCLHGLAELVLAGPRFRQSGDLRLRVRAEGIGTWEAPVVSLAGGELVTPDSTIAVDGLTIAEVARAAGLEASQLDDVYTDGPHVDPSETVRLDPGSVRVMEAAFTLGDRALHAFQPDAERTLWPEHFDVATTVDGVNFGVSPGDGHCDRPYAYVGPHHAVTGDFWNAPFGASRLVDELGDVAAITAFFVEGARLAARERP